MRSRPLPNCYWVPNTSILAGEYPGALRPAEATRKLRLLHAAGVETFIDLTEDGELEPYESALSKLGDERGTPTYYRLSVRDLSTPSPDHMRRILDLIDAEQRKGRTVYVHCWGGVGRTGTVVGCYLVRNGLRGPEALDCIAELWKDMEKRHFAPRSPETDEQRKFVLGWAEHDTVRMDRLRGHRRSSQFYRGCLLGGAVGDALGAPVEFLSWREIQMTFGPQGITELAPAYGRVGTITDDTQMTLFTAEGLLRAKVRAENKGICSISGVVHHAYLRWLRTQGMPLPKDHPVDGWLFDLEPLHHRRAPGTTCLAALTADAPGSPTEPRNNSKGCGGVMRMAPAGLVPAEDPFTLGCELAALTHGHPSGYLAAGAFAAIIFAIVEGNTLADAVAHALDRLSKYPSHEECTAALTKAVEISHRGAPSVEHLASLGEGWIAEEALAIGVYGALSAQTDFELGVRLAVNHGGDSDSTGAIAGNLLGALLGVQAIPDRWLARLELRPEIEQLADDLLTWYRPDEAWGRRYPGW